MMFWFSFVFLAVYRLLKESMGFMWKLLISNEKCKSLLERSSVGHCNRALEKLSVVLNEIEHPVRIARSRVQTNFPKSARCCFIEDLSRHLESGFRQNFQGIFMTCPNIQNQGPDIISRKHIFAPQGLVQTSH